MADGATLAREHHGEAYVPPASQAPATPSRAAQSTVAVVLSVFALGVLLRAPTFLRPLLSDDEAIYATTADAMLRGDLLYRDVVDHKPPLIYHVYQAGFAALGRYNMHGPHAAVVLSVLLTAGLLFAVRRSSDGPRVGLAAAALFLVFSTTWHDYDALAANCELFLLAPQTAAAWLALRDRGGAARGPRQLATHGLIGLLVGLCALFKYQGVTFLVASGGLLCWSAILGLSTWRRSIVLALCQAVGAALPPALYLAGCALAGNAAAAVYWFRFNFAYVGAGLGGSAAIARGLYRTMLVGGSALVPYALGSAAAIGAATAVLRLLRGRLRGPLTAHADEPAPVVVLGLLWLISSAVAVAMGGRFFGHYFHLVLAPLCLLAAPVFCRLWRRGIAYRLPLVLLCALPALFFFALSSFARPLAAAMDEGESPAYGEVAAGIDRLSAPDDRIFVWGNSPQLYVLARRPMGSRFSFCNYMTGESPGTPTETGEQNADANQLPAAWTMLFDDLESRRPLLFVDAASAGWDGYDKFPIRRYARLREYLEGHYAPIGTIAGVRIYKRGP